MRTRSKPSIIHAQERMMAWRTAGQKARTHVHVLISFSTAVAWRAKGTRSSRSAASWARRVSGAMAVPSGPKMLVTGTGVTSSSFSLLVRRERRPAALVKAPMMEETGKLNSRGVEDATLLIGGGGGFVDV